MSARAVCLVSQGAAHRHPTALRAEARYARVHVSWPQHATIAMQTLYVAPGEQESARGGMTATATPRSNGILRGSAQEVIRRTSRTLAPSSALARSR